MVDFRFYGIKIGFSIWFLSFLFFLTINKNTETTLFAVFILVHEIGHILAMAVCKMRPRAINFRFGRIEIIKQNDINLFYKNVLIFSGGIVANACCIVLLILLFPNLNEMIQINAFLIAFNSLPCGDFDGGNILREIVFYKVSDVSKAETVLKHINMTFAFLFVVLGTILLVQQNPGWMLILVGIYLIINEKIKKYS